MKRQLLVIVGLLLLVLNGCKDDEPAIQPKDPATADRALIDRFSDDAGMLFVRSANSDLPGAGVAINMDAAPFVTNGLGPDGQVVSYYNFDVQPTDPAPIFVLFKEGASSPLDGQLNILDDIPGDSDYNDFWQVMKVTVPADYVANTVTSYQEIIDNGYSIESTPMLVNCPVVPEGSTAAKRLNGGETALQQGWYQGKAVFYFVFGEKALTTSSTGMVPLSPIYVSFNINPDQPGGGPPSGFKHEDGTNQSHNVVATIPSDSGYSPLWSVNIYDNAEFDNVSDLSTATMSTILATGAALVNCPIIEIQ